MAQMDLSADRLSYCADQVRRDDPDRFLMTLFAPAERRESLWAIWAFNLEVAKTRERVREPLLGQIRLQWWRDAIAEIYEGRPREHAVVTALAAAVGAHNLARGDLEALIDAREADLSAEPPADMAALEAYAARSAGAPLALALQALGVRASDSQRSALAAPLAMVGLMLALPFRGLHGRVDLPSSLLSAADLIPEAVIDPSARSAVVDIVRQVAVRAREMTQAALSEAKSLPLTARPALLSVTLAKRHLRRLERAGFDPFNPALGRRDGFLGAALWWAMRTGRL